METIISCLVRGKNDQYEFEITATECLTKGERSIPDAFYTDNEAEPPNGVHWELLLIKSPVWGRTAEGIPIHTYKHFRTGDPYICFTGQIVTQKMANAVFRRWCLGTVYTIENQIDFNELQVPSGTNFEEYLQNTFGISIDQ